MDYEYISKILLKDESIRSRVVSLANTFVEYDHKDGDSSDALRLYDAILESAAENNNKDWYGAGGAWIGKGFLKEKEQDFEEAEKFYRKAGDIRGISDVAHDLVRCLMAQDKFQEVVDLFPHVSGNDSYREAQFRAGHLDEAKKTYQVCIKSYSASQAERFITMLRGDLTEFLVCLSDRDPIDALDYFHKHLNLDNPEATVLKKLPSLLSNPQEEIDAIGYARNKLLTHIEPNLKQLANDYMSEGDTAEADKYFTLWKEARGALAAELAEKRDDNLGSTNDTEQVA